MHPHLDPRRRCLKVADWPEPDRLAWEEANKTGDIFDDSVGRAASWADQTREKYRKGYGRWLTFLAGTGRLDGSDPAARVIPAVVAEYVDELSSTVGSWTTWGRVAELRAAIAVMVPSQDFRWLRRIVAKLEVRTVSSRDKIRRLRPAAEIAAWAYARMDELNEPGVIGRFHAVHFRDALMVALLITCPAMRLGNLTAIEIGRQLRKIGTRYELNFEAYETKTRKPLLIPVPDDLRPYLDRYIDHYRVSLRAGRDSKRLWINYAGGPLSQKSTYGAIVVSTRRAFGTAINPHLFRDCAVTSVAIDDPEHIGIAAPILGHTDLRTTERHYIHANAIAASRKLRHSIDELRDNHRPRQQPRRRQSEP